MSSREPPFDSYSEAAEWLFGTQLFGLKLGLENVRRLCEELNVPGKRQQFVHVAGTNGKGSVCAMIAALLQASSWATGLFTSPHLVSFTERMRIDGRRISESEVTQRLSAIRERIRHWEPHPTFFEITLALALDWFNDEAAEVVVLETGMGGRLDATNVVTPIVSVITPIALDHQKWLGDSLGAIAREKAGIFKRGIPAVSSAQVPEVEAALREVAARVRAPLTILEENAGEQLRCRPLGLAGPHQVANAALALAAVRAAGLNRDEKNWPAALESVRWRARFERLQDGRIIVDAAHNLHAACALVTTWQREFGNEKARLIFGAVEGKPCSEMLSALGPIVSEIHYVGVNSPRAVSPDVLNEYCHPHATLPCHTHPDLPSALEGILAPGAQDRSRILIAGSIFLAGEALAFFEDAEFEVSTQ